MNIVDNLITSAPIEALGWTLVHAVWQSLFFTIGVILILRLIPTKYANLRYAVAGSGLLLVVLVSVGTFAYLSSVPGPLVLENKSSVFQTVAVQSGQTHPISARTLVLGAAQFIQCNISSIVLLWSAGAMLFSLRLIGGWWYVNKLRENSIPVEDLHTDVLQRLSEELGIVRLAMLAESPRIQAPVVIGYLKPIILIPLGMLSGLSNDQLESVILHELIHIRRGDYLINIVQSFVEGLFFYNPFVWTLSAIMRREREHCCDDEVVLHQGKPLAYALALATLEEVRLSRAGLSLSLAENKKELLNRIRRIMETSVHCNSGRQRMIPAALLVIGLLSASWMTIQPGKPGEGTNQKERKAYVTTSDTTIRHKNSTMRHDHKTVSVADPETPDQEIFEEIEVAVDIDPLIMDIEPVPAIPEIELIHDFEVAVPPMPPVDFMIDTIPAPKMVFPDWEEFSASFEENFKMNFGEFYALHEKELKDMMSKMEFKFDHQFNDEWTSKMKQDVAWQEEYAMRNAKNLSRNKDLIQQKEAWEKEAKAWEKAHTADMVKMKTDMEALETSMKAFEKNLSDQLVKDGYLKAGENVNSININDGTVEVNGKAIKAADQEKYKALIDQLSRTRAETHFKYSNRAGRKE